MEDKKRIILGLDVSTSTIGISIILDDNSKYGQLIELTHVTPKAKDYKGVESLFIKKRLFQEEFLTKWRNCGITDVIIEEPLIRSNNINTCATLLRFNSMIADAVYNTLGVVPKFISSYHARLYAFPELYSVRKYKRDGSTYDEKKILQSLSNHQMALFGAYPWDIDKKQILQQKVAEIFPQVTWLYNAKGELKQENYDSVDAYICILGVLNKERHPSKKDSIEMIVSDVVQDGNVINYKLNYWGEQDERVIFI